MVTIKATKTRINNGPTYKTHYEVSGGKPHEANFVAVQKAMRDEGVQSGTYIVYDRTAVRKD